MALFSCGRLRTEWSKEAAERLTVLVGQVKKDSERSKEAAERDEAWTVLDDLLTDHRHLIKGQAVLAHLQTSDTHAEVQTSTSCTRINARVHAHMHTHIPTQTHPYMCVSMHTHTYASTQTHRCADNYNRLIYESFTNRSQIQFNKFYKLIC